MNVRAQASLALKPILSAEASLQSTFDPNIDSISDRDKALFHELCYGVLRQYEWLACISSRLLAKPLRKKDNDVYALILLGLYQLHFLRTPDHAAISETVVATRQIKKQWAKGLVNGVLRQFQRDKEKLVTATNRNNAANHRCPEWLLERLSKDWPNKVHHICLENQEKPPLSLRVNQRRWSREQAFHAISPLFPSHVSDIAANGIVLSTAADPLQIPGFIEGKLSVQDEAAQLCAELLDLMPGHRVLDACAAPGGKSCHILESCKDLEQLTAVELDRQRAQVIHENLKRLSLSAEVKIADASDTNSWWNGEPFDRILLDAPCSATGVIRRHPDIKLLRQPGDLAKLAAIQSSLLKALWPLLKAGGVFVYATCSLLKEENEDTVNGFLAATDDAEHEEIKSDWGEKRSAGRQLFPRRGGNDGFYYAKLKKRLF